MQYAIEQPGSSLQPSPQLGAFAKRLNRNAQLRLGPERRSEPRQPIVLSVIAQPIDGKGQPVGPPFAAVTRDLSTWGVGLVHEQPMIYDRLALRLNVDSEEALLVGEVRWRSPQGPFYACGCQVTGRLDQFPEPPPRVHCASPTPNRIDPPSDSWPCPA